MTKTCSHVQKHIYILSKMGFSGAGRPSEIRSEALRFKLAPSWPQDGFQIAPRWFRMGPRWLQDGPETAPRRPKMAPRYLKMAQRCPKMASRWPQDGPKVAQDGPMMAQDVLKMDKAAMLRGCIDGINTSTLHVAQDGPKMAQDGSKMAPRRHQGQES